MRVIAYLLLCYIYIGCHSETQQQSNLPNIIFLLTDDQRWDALGIMGNSIIKTPNLDRLAGSGVLFKNSYVTTSICAVSRASFFSGQYMSRHGIEDFQTSFLYEDFDQTYPMMLKKAGYNIGFIGKFGVGKIEEQPASKFDFWTGSDKGQPDYEMVDEEGNYIHHTDKVGNDVERFLNEWGNKGPFNLSVSFKAPHVQDNDPRQFIINPRYINYYKDDSIPIPLTADPKFWEGFPDFFRTKENISRERWNLRFKTPEMYQESVKNYYRLITDVDDMVGRLVEQLEANDLANNTVIIFMSDNGFYLGEHGLAGKWFGHEESIRVPLFIYDPRRKREKNGITSEEIALNIDIAPTILKLANQDVPEAMQGVDLLAMVDNSENVINRYDFFYEHTYLGSPKIPKIEGVVSREEKYMIFTEHGFEQYFDLRKDPMETKNLVHDPAYEEKVNELRERYKVFKQKVK